MNKHPTTEELHRAQVDRSGRLADLVLAVSLAAIAVFLGLEAAKVF